MSNSVHFIHNRYLVSSQVKTGIDGCKVLYDLWVVYLCCRSIPVASIVGAAGHVLICSRLAGICLHVGNDRVLEIGRLACRVGNAVLVEIKPCQNQAKICLIMAIDVCN